MITSVVTRSRLCPPTSSWPQTPGCHIPGFVLWMCVPMAREVGGLREGVWGGCHPWAEARSLWALPQPQTPTMGNITSPAKKHPESLWAWAPSAPVFLQMIMDFTILALTLTPLEAKHAKPHPCQAEDSICLLVQVETGGKSQRQELSEVLSAITLENSLVWVSGKKLRKCQGTKLTYERFHKVNNLAHNLLRF